VSPTAAPERMCLGCRARRAQAELVRLKAAGGVVRVARPGEPGRSGYVCPEVTCLEAADKRRAFARAFRGQVILDPAVRHAVVLAGGERQVR
jgi:predicted RNA-binding protein YlxR (DUF448 family)